MRARACEGAARAVRVRMHTHLHALSLSAAGQLLETATALNMTQL